MARQCYMTPDQSVQFFSNQESSTSNQAEQNQPITNYINQALPKSSYSGIATNNQALQQQTYSGIASNNIPPPRIMPILKLKIIPPFNKDHFATKTTFETASN